MSDLEASLGGAYTVDTIDFLKIHCPGVHFVWLMGADNLANFHRWKKWQEIAALVPIAVIDRPGSTLAAIHSRAAKKFWRYRLDDSDGLLLADRPPPAFIFLHGLGCSLSSTALRAAAKPPDGAA